MRKPAIQTASDREDRNAAGGGISLSQARHLEALLEVSGLDARLPADFMDRCERYVALLLAANTRLNLTRVTQPAEVARLHLLDALAALPLIDAWGPRRAVDLGSGGGVPGIPLALARPDVTWLLVDSVGKKAAALRSFVADLGLHNVTVAAERAETLGRDPAHREHYDFVAARACAPLPVLAELALPLIRPGGRLLAWKGQVAGSDELARGAAAAELLGGGEPSVHASLPALGDHTLVEVPKLGPTPDRFPRRPGLPARRPLA
jgi:16S rRNA (guanine527-N7)-methyltransferase